jgi:hypothetical protein
LIPTRRRTRSGASNALSPGARFFGEAKERLDRQDLWHLSGPWVSRLPLRLPLPISISSFGDRTETSPNRLDFYHPWMYPIPGSSLLPSKFPGKIGSSSTESPLGLGNVKFLGSSTKQSFIFSIIVKSREISAFGDTFTLIIMLGVL